VDESRSTKPWRILCEVYAKLLAMLVQHGVFLVSCWASPNRGLVKAAQTVQKHALHLASTFGSLRGLLTALSTVQRCVAAGCRMNRRKKHPNTYQLLFNDLSMTAALA
jgi:sulfur relay (sulfurtransferase) complex TusBCD TusD component (DsrE family)